MTGGGPLDAGRYRRLDDAAKQHRVRLDSNPGKSVSLQVFGESGQESITVGTSLSSVIDTAFGADEARSAFVSFPKVTRWNREVLVTEKIDGTNGQIHIVDANDEDTPNAAFTEAGGGLRVYAASRNRYLLPGGESDNHLFCLWAFEHASELAKLGPGRHFGEWWGRGIQRGYGLTEKRFSLFNVAKWSDDAVRPACCHVVPVLARGPFASLDPMHVAHRLRTEGSHAAPGFMRPEGIVLFHTPSNVLFKYTLDKNDGHKESA